MVLEGEQKKASENGLDLSAELLNSVRWRDSRLRFRNLRKPMSQNVLGDVSDIWQPELSITGASDLVAEREDKKEVNFVDKQGHHLPDDDVELDEGG